MKKIILLTIILMIILSITGCSKRENPSDSLTEISVYELLEIFDTDQKMIFGIVDNNVKNSDLALKALTEYQKTSKNFVYYIDTTNITFIEQEYLNILLNRNYDELRFYILKNGSIVLDESIPFSTSEITNLIGNEMYNKIDMSNLLNKRESYYSEALNALGDGFISSAYNNIYLAKPKDEAKDMIENENIFNILNTWETTIKKGDTCTYLSLNFLKGRDSIYRQYYKGKCSKLDKTKLEVEIYDYYYSDDVIYAKKENESEYKALYTITDLNSEKLNIKTSKTKYEMQLKQQTN